MSIEKQSWEYESCHNCADLEKEVERLRKTEKAIMDLSHPNVLLYRNEIERLERDNDRYKLALTKIAGHKYHDMSMVNHYDLEWVNNIAKQALSEQGEK